MPVSLRLFLLSILLYPILGPSVARAGDEWLPIPPEELTMTSEPGAPGAPAIYLYRQLDRTDVTCFEYNYYRIKVFNEEGRKYADIEIPFVKDSEHITNIEARTIHPDGRTINFDGKIYEKTILKARGIRYLAKTFTLPDVQPGSILEYRYTRGFPKYVYDSRWLLSEDLFTRHANFSLRRSRFYPVQWSLPRGLPEGTSHPVDDHGVVRMEAHNIPAFQIEDYMPPQEEMKYRVEFTYLSRSETDPDRFWKDEAKALDSAISKFVDKRNAMEQALAQIVSPADTAEQKLQKIYARCQRIRNTSFEREKTEQEQHREKMKEPENVADVWNRGYGDGWGISWLFLALVRTAGLEASPVLLSTRDRHFFNPKSLNASDLNTNAVLVRLNGKDLYFDPGTAFTPFGLLPWYETGVTGLLVDKAGSWIKTSLPDPSVSGTDRQATLQLDDSGALEGKVTVTYKGLSALGRRIDERDADEAERKKFLEDELKAAIPGTPAVELTNSPDWSTSSNTLTAEYHVSVPGWASSAGRRLLIPAGVFGGNEKHLFESSSRIHPIAFAYPYIDADDITVKLPPSWTLENLPTPKPLDLKNCTYTLTAAARDGNLHLSRKLMLNLILVDSTKYDILRDFFQGVRTGDEQQAVLSSEN